MPGIEGFLGRVKGTGADVTVDDAERGKRQCCAGLLQMCALGYFPAPLNQSRGFYYTFRSGEIVVPGASSLAPSSIFLDIFDLRTPRVQRKRCYTTQRACFL